jgi:hypothetical protein
MKAATKSLLCCEMMVTQQVRVVVAPAPAVRVAAASRISPEAGPSPFAVSKIAEVFFFYYATVVVQRLAAQVEGRSPVDG